MANINPNGMGCNLFITTSALFNELATQADARGITVHQGGIPGHSTTGFKYPVICHDNVYYTWSKDVPSGKMYCLDLDSVMLEVHPQLNFKFSGFTKKNLSDEGGALYEYGTFDAMIRLSIRRPWLMGSFTGLTTV